MMLFSIFTRLFRSSFAVARRSYQILTASILAVSYAAWNVSRAADANLDAVGGIALFLAAVVHHRASLFRNGHRWHFSSQLAFDVALGL